MRPTVSVVIPTWNRPEAAVECLLRVTLQDYPQELMEVVVIDDGSPNGPPAMPDDIGDVRVRIIHASHGGANSARNRGIAESTGELVAFLDDDSVPSRTWVSELVAVARQRGVGMVGGRVKAAGSKTFTASVSNLGEVSMTGFDAGEEFEAVDVDHVPGGNMAVWRDVLQEMGGFDSAFTWAWRDETDLCVSVKRAGHRILFTGRAVVEHPTDNRNAWWILRPKNQFRVARNNGYFVGKHFIGARTFFYWIILEPSRWTGNQVLRTGALLIALPAKLAGTIVGLWLGWRTRRKGA